ncbi:hypothetical protein CASFOL_041740 [Castilleja foliolosa]|uniref:Phytocyanin domain-containing protein n=1 Tax=Castilleja foliolosa TaxID=1961234 RepID=A0ABD3B997_9LAMI
MDKAIVLIVLLLISPAAYAATHNVGDTRGWTTGGEYATWASAQNFTVGDTLVFTYASTHAVDEVTEDNYNSCNTSSPLSTNSPSPTTITLNTTGTRYFICPRAAHCSTGGQKLSITVAAAGATSPPAGSTPSTPAGSTPATPGKNPPPAPPSAAATLGGGDSLMVGLMSLVLVAVVGLN